jgi:hypothetical protein
MNFRFTLAILFWTLVACAPTLAQKLDFEFYQSNLQSVQNYKGGYYVLEVTGRTINGAPVKYDAEYNICFETGTWNSPQVHSKVLTIEAGKSVGVCKLLYQVNINRNAYWWAEKDKNNLLDSREQPHGLTTSYSGYLEPQNYLFLSSSVSLPKPILPGTRNVRSMTANNAVVGADMPSFDILGSMLTESIAQFGNNGLQNNGTTGTNTWQPVLANSTSIKANVPDSLPDNWVELSAIQNIFISLEDLKDVAEFNPEKVAALKKWLAAGGRLIVNNCGEGCKKSQQIYRFLGIPLAPPPEWKQLKEKAWSQINANFIRDRKQGFGVDPNFLESNRTAKFEDTMLEPYSRDSQSTAEFKPVLSRYGQGQIVAIDNDMSDWKVKDWSLLLATLETAGADFLSNIGESVLAGIELEGISKPLCDVD